jgi:hypothetical protein
MPKKKAELQMSEDEIRESILKYFYDAWKNPRGMESHKLMISKICSDLKEKGIEKKYVIRNLHYLIETKWVVEEIKESQYITVKMRIPTEKKTYYISQNGIDFFDKPSKFQKTNPLAGVNMGNVVNSVIILGDNNYVRNENKVLGESLGKFGNQIRLSSELSDDEKIDYQAEINTIKSQLAKINPDKGIIEKSWNILKKGVATIGGIAGVYNTVKPLIDSFLG